MYAVISHGGKQLRVAPGDVVRVERVDGESGASIELSDVRLVADGDSLQCGEATQGRRVVGTVLRQGKHAKVIVFKKKRRKQYRRTRGHRQRFTEIRIDRIE